MQDLDFATINQLTKIPKQREGIYPRYVLEKLGRTWVEDGGDDKNWFDKAIIFQELHKDLVARLESKCVVDSSSKFSNQSEYICLSICVRFNFLQYSTIVVRKLGTISDFHRHRALILDCWTLYLHKKFKNNEQKLELDFFPMWNNSQDVNELLEYSCATFCSISS